MKSVGRNANPAISAEAGATPLIILLVGVIIGLLAVVAVLSIRGCREQAQGDTAAAGIDAIKFAVEMFENDNGKLPASLKDLVTSEGTVLPGLDGESDAKPEGCTLESSTQATLLSLELALRMYEIDNGRYPGSLQNLLEPGREPNWNGPYVNKYPVMDAWGSEIAYSADGSGFSLASPGPDKTSGTDDDMVLVHER